MAGNHGGAQSGAGRKQQVDSDITGEGSDRSKRSRGGEYLHSQGVFSSFSLFSPPANHSSSYPGIDFPLRSWDIKASAWCSDPTVCTDFPTPNGGARGSCSCSTTEFGPIKHCSGSANNDFAASLAPYRRIRELTAITYV